MKLFGMAYAVVAADIAVATSHAVTAATDLKKIMEIEKEVGF